MQESIPSNERDNEPVSEDISRTSQAVSIIDLGPSTSKGVEALVVENRPSNNKVFVQFLNFFLATSNILNNAYTPLPFR